MPSFTYNASAIGIGGLLNRGGTPVVVPSLASVALAPTGGEGGSTVYSYNQDGISFNRAQTTVSGTTSPDGKVHTTYTDVVITNLTVFDRLHVDFLRASVQSVSDMNVTPGTALTTAIATIEPRFTFTAEIVGMFVDDQEVIPTLGLTYLNGNPTYGMLGNELLASMPMYRNRFGWTPTEESELALARANNQPIRCSMLETTRLPQVKGFKLTVPKLGHVHLGEVIVKPGRRRINFLRLDVDRNDAFSAVSNLVGRTDAAGGTEVGTLTIASIEGNGSPSWP